MPLPPPSILPASHTTTNDVVFAMVAPHLKPNSRILDFGAGRGAMCARLADHCRRHNNNPQHIITACEVAPQNFQCADVQCHKINFDSVIPFADNEFDVVYAIEVLEHTKRPYDLITEAQRVLKNDGLLVISIPNLMHIAARLSSLFSGISRMWPPPTADKKYAGNITGHIMPLHYPYLVYGLRTAGFTQIRHHTDRKKSGAMVLAVCLYPFLKLGSHIAAANLKRRYPQVWAENAEVVRTVNSMDLLTSRSCIVSAHKKATV